MLNLQSNPPKAQVYAAPLGGGTPKLLGETPLTVPVPSVQRDYGGSGPVILEFRRNGYLSSKTIITDLSAGDITVNLELQATTGLEDAERLNSVVDSVFEGQRLARVGRADEALARLKQVESQAPQLAATYELEGGILYLQKKYREALDAYSLAVKFNPKAQESIRMRNMLEVALGVTRKSLPKPNAAEAGGSTP